MGWDSSAWMQHNQHSLFCPSSRAPKIAGVWHTLSFAWRASATAALCLVGPSPWHSLHTLRSLTFCCLAFPSPDMGAFCCPLCLQHQLSGPGSPPAHGAGLFSVCWLCHSLSLPLPKPNLPSNRCNLGYPSNHSLMRISPRCRGEEDGPGVSIVAQGMQWEAWLFFGCVCTGAKAEQPQVWCAWERCRAAPVCAVTVWFVL